MRVALATTVLPGLDHVGPLERAQRDVTVVRRAADLAELIAVARSGLVDVALVADGADRLDAAVLEELTTAARPVGVLAMSEVREDRARLRELGVPCVRADIPPLELARVVAEVARVAVTGAEADPMLGADEQEASAPAGAGAGDAAGTGDVDRSAMAAEGAGTGEGTGAAVPSIPVEFAERTAPAAPPVAATAADTVWGVPAPQGAGSQGTGVEGSGGEGTGTTTPAGSPPTHQPPTQSAPEQSVSGRSVSEQPGPARPTSDIAGAPAGPGPHPAPATGVDAAASGARPEPAQVLVVWGPTGAPGRTTVAVNLAAETAAAGLRTLLVDLDTYGPAVGVHLGLTEESAGVSRAARRADRGRLTVEDVVAAAVRVRVAGAPLDVLTGVTRPDRWPEVRAGAVERILTVARQGWERVVVDVGFCLEEDEELSFDIPAPQRNGATLAALGAADRVLAVGGADAVALPRLLRGVEVLGQAASGAEVEVVVNRVRPAASGVSPESQIAGVWARYGPDLPVVAHLPWDPSAADRALLGGQVLAEAAPQSPLRRALAELARRDPAVARAAAGRPKRRRLIPWPAPSPRTP